MAKVPRYDFYRPHKRLYADVNADGESITGVSMTKQSFVAECDINNILKEYGKTGMFRHVNERAAQGMYADLPDPLDFQEALNVVMQSEQAFAAMPSKLRSRFNNDPEQLLAFLANKENQDEAIALGLAIDNRPKPPIVGNPGVPAQPAVAPSGSPPEAGSEAGGKPPA